MILLVVIIVGIIGLGVSIGSKNDENIGGWGAILEFAGHQKELYGGEINTTNNRMERTALLEALKAIKKDNQVILPYKLSEVEKNNYRQLLLILSILEARANAKALATSGTEITPENVEEGTVLPTIDAPETSNQEEFSENEYYCENCQTPTQSEVSPEN